MAAGDKILFIYNKYYKDINYDVYLSLIVHDPTTPFRDNRPDKFGQYCQWLLNVYKQKNLKTEDFYKAKEYLTLFHELKSKNLIQNEDRDIGKIKNLTELLNLNERIGGTGEIQKDEDYLLSDRFFINTRQAILLFENERWLIVTPKTYDASQFYACYTQWCTQYPDQYRSYSESGDLIIFINKEELNSDNSLRRLQFHFQSRSFMNINDASISYLEFIQREVCLSDFFIEIFKKFIDYSEYDIITSEVLNLYPSLKEYELRRRVNKGMLLSEDELKSLSDLDKIKTINAFLIRYDSNFLPIYYYNCSNNKQRVFVIKRAVKNEFGIQKSLLPLIDPLLIDYYIKERYKKKQPVEDCVFDLATEELKKEYIKNVNVEKVTNHQFSSLDINQKKSYLEGLVKNGKPYISDEIFFNDMTDDLKNFFIGILYSKFGENDVQFHLSKKQYSWATTDGFL